MESDSCCTNVNVFWVPYLLFLMHQLIFTMIIIQYFVPFYTQKHVGPFFSPRIEIQYCNFCNTCDTIVNAYKKNNTSKYRIVWFIKKGVYLVTSRSNSSILFAFHMNIVNLLQLKYYLNLVFQALNVL